MHFGLNGISVCYVSRDEATKPTLDFCEYIPLDEKAGFLEKLALLLKNQDLEHARCTCVLPPDSHSLLLIEAPDVQPAELKAAVRWRIKDLINFHIDDAVIDVFEIPEQNSAPGRARLMYAVAARASQIHDNVESLEKTSLNLEMVDIPELAIRNITSLLDDDIRGVAFLYLSQESGLITLTRQGSLYLSRNIDVGSNQMGNEQKGDELNPQAQQAFDKIVLEVQRSLDYYESHFSQPPITSLVIAPMGKEVAGILPHLSANLGIAVSMFDINTVMDTNDEISNDLQAKCLLAIGAGLRHEQKVL